MECLLPSFTRQAALAALEASGQRRRAAALLEAAKAWVERFFQRLDKSEVTYDSAG